MFITNKNHALPKWSLSPWKLLQCDLDFVCVVSVFHAFLLSFIFCIYFSLTDHKSPLCDPCSVSISLDLEE